MDGAHTPGQVCLDNIANIGADYYTSNLHKWYFAPPTAAFLWVSPKAPSKQKLHHPIISHSYDKGFFEETAMLGTKDYSAMLSVPSALDFIDSLGGSNLIIERNTILCRKAVECLSEAWDTRNYCQLERIETSIIMVACPKCLGNTWEDSKNLKNYLRKENIIIQWPYPVGGDRLYLRISCAIYNAMADFELLRDKVLEYANSIMKIEERDKNLEKI